MPGHGTGRRHARPLQHGCRAALFAGSLILAGFVAGGEAPACEDLPATRQEQCRQVMRCMAVDDDDARRACIDAAQRQPAPAIEREKAPPQQRQPPSQEQQTLHEQQVEPAPASPPVQREPSAPSASPPLPPEEFGGTVSRVYQSILDRQLIAVDAQYLFESDRASHARLKTGERVEVVKMSSRFVAGRRWRIIGPSRTPIVAFRIRCENEGIRSDDRRKCTQMLER